MTPEETRAARLLRRAPRIAAAVGAGFSAAAGPDEADAALARAWLPGFTEIGLPNIRAIREIIGPLDQNRPEVYWGFWGQYLLRAQYTSPLPAAWAGLAGLLKGRDFFLCALTGGGQALRADLPEERLFLPQGDPRLFQCAHNCRGELWENEEALRTMEKYLMTPREIDTRDIPVCPCCGGPALPNLRACVPEADFAEGPCQRTGAAWRDFLRAPGEETVLLELGVGDEPGADFVRRGFEEAALARPETVLLRVGRACAPLPAALGERGVLLETDPAEFLETL